MERNKITNKNIFSFEFNKIRSFPSIIIFFCLPIFLFLITGLGGNLLLKYLDTAPENDPFGINFTSLFDYSLSVFSFVLIGVWFYSSFDYGNKAIKNIYSHGVKRIIHILVQYIFSIIVSILVLGVLFILSAIFEPIFSNYSSFKSDIFIRNFVLTLLGFFIAGFPGIFFVISLTRSRGLSFWTFLLIIILPGLILAYLDNLVVLGKKSMEFLKDFPTPFFTFFHFASIITFLEQPKFENYYWAIIISNYFAYGSIFSYLCYRCRLKDQD